MGKGIVRPVTDQALAYLKTEVYRPVSERGVKDIMDAEGWIPGLIARIESDTEWRIRLQDENKLLRSLMTPEQVLQLGIDKSERVPVKYGND